MTVAVNGDSQFVGPAGSTATTLAVTIMYMSGFIIRYFSLSFYPINFKPLHYDPQELSAFFKELPVVFLDHCVDRCRVNVVNVG